MRAMKNYMLEKSCRKNACAAVQANACQHMPYLRSFAALFVTVAVAALLVFQSFPYIAFAQEELVQSEPAQSESSQDSAASSEGAQDSSAQGEPAQGGQSQNGTIANTLVPGSGETSNTKTHAITHEPYDSEIPTGIVGPVADSAYEEPFKVDHSYVNTVKGGIFARLGLFEIYAQEEEYQEDSVEYSGRDYDVVTKSEVQAAKSPFYLFSNSSEKSEHDVYLLVATDLSWEGITRGLTPNLYEFLGNNASANVINDCHLDCDYYTNTSNFHYLFVPQGTAQEVEYILADTLANIGEQDTLIITSSTCFLEDDPDESAYSVLILKDTEDTGLLTSTTTRRMGLVTAGDVQNAIWALLDAPQKKPADLDIYTFTNAFSTSLRLDELVHDSTTAQALQASQPSFVSVFIVCLSFTIIFSLLLFFLEMRIRPKILAYLLPIVRVLWLFSLAIPLASYVMFLHIPSVADTTVMLDYCWFYAISIAFIGLVISLLTNWMWSYVVITTATVFTLIVDQLLGGPLSAGGYLSYAPIEHVRYYGIGNEGAALLFGAWVCVAGLYITRSPHSRITAMLKKWLYPVLSILVMAVIAAPWWGANFGVLIWGSVGIYISWRLLCGAHLRKRELAAAICLAGALAFFVLVADTSFNGESHMGGQINFSGSDWLSQLETIFSDMAQMSFNTLVYSPPLTVIFFLLIVVLIVLYFRQPGTYKKFWQENMPFLGTSKALLVSAILMLFIEDSGILMPALLILYPVSGLVWLLCDYHSWHIRDFLNRRNIYIVRRETGHEDANEDE